jgi:CelD/BcsL family acetyltransferase involved in cellulose biosynthesis
VKLRVVTSLQEFDALARTWSEVMRASGQTSPFLSHDWFACCWRTARPEQRRELWLVEDSAGPLALLPFARSDVRVHGMPVRKIEFLNAPDTPFIDFPATRGIEEITSVVVDWLASRRDWDLLSLDKLPPDSATYRALIGAITDRMPWRVADTVKSPYLNLAGTWEEFLRARTQRFRKTYRNIENRLRRAGDAIVEVHRDVDPDGALFAEVMTVSRASWKGPRGIAMATMQGMPRFFHELTGRASANGWLHLWVLRVNGRAVATEYQIAENGRRYALRADFDASMGDVSPGGYLNQHIVRTLFDDQTVHEYDMGPGTNEYKLRWASGNHESVVLHVYAPSARARILYAIETRLLPLARRCRARLKSSFGAGSDQQVSEGPGRHAGDAE